MNKKGFTLVEILAVIVILSLLIAIAVPSSITISNKIKQKLLDEKITFIEKAAILWAQDNRRCFTIDECSSLQAAGFTCTENTNTKTCNINVDFLINENYHDDEEDGKVLNPVDNSKCLNNYSVEILYNKKNKTFTSKVPTTGQDSSC